MTLMLEDSTTHPLHITQMISDNAESVAAVYKVLNDAFMQENKSCTSNRNYSCHLQFNSVNHFLLI